MGCQWLLSRSGIASISNGFKLPRQLKVEFVGPPIDEIRSTKRYLSESFSVRVSVKVPVSLANSVGTQVVFVKVQSNVTVSSNPDGEWAVYDMIAETTPSKPGSRSWGVTDEAKTSSALNASFLRIFTPTKIGKYFFKVKARFNDAPADDPASWTYLGDENRPFKLKVVSVDPNSGSWNKGPIAVEVHPNLYVGNFMAACDAKSYGFGAILNVAEELDIDLDSMEDPKPIYKKIPLVDGTINPISAEHIKTAIRWLEAREGVKTLINCRAGCGRSGSIAIAYKARKLPNLSYDEVLDAILTAKSDITPHKNLQQTIESMRGESNF